MVRLALLSLSFRADFPTELVEGSSFPTKTPPTKEPVPPDISGTHALLVYDDYLIWCESLGEKDGFSKATDNVRTSKVQYAPSWRRTPIEENGKSENSQLSPIVKEAHDTSAAVSTSTPLPWRSSVQLGLRKQSLDRLLQPWRPLPNASKPVTTNPLLCQGSSTKLGLGTPSSDWRQLQWRRPSTSLLTTANEPQSHHVLRLKPGEEDIIEIPYRRPLPGQKRKMPGDLASGDIITLQARLQEIGFRKADEIRWYLVLGKVKFTNRYVISPIATFKHQGTQALGWKAAYAKPIEKATKGSPSAYNRRQPTQAVFSEKYRCQTGSTLLLANAFTVRANQSGTFDADFQGYLTKKSFEDVSDCVQHLIASHPREARYSFGRDLNEWDLEEVKRIASSCKECHLGVGS